jgi:hypothetical protein
MFKKSKIQNQYDADSGFWNFFGFWFVGSAVVSDFVLRISDLFRWCFGVRNLLVKRSKRKNQYRSESWQSEVAG